MGFTQIFHTVTYQLKEASEIFDFNQIDGLWYSMTLSTIFQLYIVAVSFIGGGN